MALFAEDVDFDGPIGPKLLEMKQVFYNSFWLYSSVDVGKNFGGCRWEKYGYEPESREILDPVWLYLRILVNYKRID